MVLQWPGHTPNAKVAGWTPARATNYPTYNELLRSTGDCQDQSVPSKIEYLSLGCFVLFIPTIPCNVDPQYDDGNRHRL